MSGINFHGPKDVRAIEVLLYIGNCRLLCHLLVILKVIFANSVDPDQTAPLGAVWSGSTLLACMQK